MPKQTPQEVQLKRADHRLKIAKLRQHQARALLLKRNREIEQAEHSQARSWHQFTDHAISSAIKS
jgi:hypothetical protein